MLGVVICGLSASGASFRNLVKREQKHAYWSVIQESAATTGQG